MPSFNKSITAGNLTRDPEMRYTPAGKGICQFGLAINRQWTTDDGKKKEEVLFLDYKAFGRTAEVISQYAKKGSALLVEGRISREEWEDKTTGAKKSATRIIVESFQFLGSKDGPSDGESPAPRQAPAARPAAHPPTTPAPAGEEGPIDAGDGVPF